MLSWFFQTRESCDPLSTGVPSWLLFCHSGVTSGPARGAGRAGAQFPAPAGCVERRRVRLLCTEPIRVSARPSQPVTLPVGEKGKSLFLNAETGYGIVSVSEFMFWKGKCVPKAAVGLTSLPSVQGPRCMPVGIGVSVKTCLGSATLLGLALQAGPERPAVALGLGRFGCACGRSGAARTSFPYRKVVSAHGLVFGFTFLPRVLEMLAFKREVSLVDYVSDFGF